MKYTLIFSIFFLVNISNAQDAAEIVKKSNDIMQGASNEMTMTMKIIRPKWERTVSMQTWNLGNNFSMVLITSPAREKGQTFLKRNNEMWNYIPSINRMVKLPPSMLSQGWMSSDFTNNDLLNESSLVVDYSHKIIGEETIEGNSCYIIELRPKPNAPVVWGKIITSICKTNYFRLKSEYYDESEILMRTEKASNIKNMGGRNIPTEYEVIPADKKNQKTVMTIESAKFNLQIDESFFSQQNMKNLN